MSRAEWLSHFEEKLEPHIHSLCFTDSRKFLIAQKVIVIHFLSGEVCALLTDALAHREIFDDSPPVLSVYVVQRSDVTPKCQVSNASSRRPSRLWRFHGDPSVIELYSPDLSRAYCLIDDARTLKFWTLASPFRRILDWFFTGHGIEIVHGAAVGVGNKAVLITGPGGSGKSTTGMKCYADGMNYLGDDHVAITQDGTAYGIYRSLKVRNDNSFAVAGLGRILPCQGEKKVLMLESTSALKFPQSASLEGVLIPRITSGVATHVRQHEFGKVPPELLPFALKQSDWLSSLQCSVLTTLVESLPCFDLVLGSENHAIPTIIKEFCSGSCSYVHD
jgi:hypothetical protein